MLVLTCRHLPACDTGPQHLELVTSSLPCASRAVGILFPLLLGMEAYVVILIAAKCFHHCYLCAYTNLQGVAGLHYQILHSGSATFPPHKKRQSEKPSLHLFYYKTNQYSSSSLHTHRHPSELLSHGCVEITYLNPAPK